MNINQLLFDRVRRATAHDLADDSILLYMNQVRDASLSTSADAEEVTDATGSPITTFYQAKRATFTGTNAIFSLDLMAAQQGTEKEIASSTSKIKAPISETLTVKNKKLTLAHTPVANSLPWIYTISNGNLSSKYGPGSAASATEFLLSGKEITVPTGVADGTVFYVEYEYESTGANKISVATNKFPEAMKLRIEAIFRDVCNENTVYAGIIIAPKAKLSAESAEVSFDRTSGHPFEFRMQKDYCAEDEQLFYIVVLPDDEED